MALVDLPAPASQDYLYPPPPDPRYEAPARLIDLTRFPLGAQFTKNFKAQEFLSPAKGRYGFIEPYLVHHVQELRDGLGSPVIITSGYRSPRYNGGVGGVGLSRHMYGDAVDMESSAGLTAMKDQCEKLGASYIQLYTDGHIHCDWRNHEPDGVFYGAPSETLAQTQFLEEQYAFTGTPRISVEGRRVAGERVVLRAEIAHQEDPGELLREWTVVFPSGRVFRSRIAAPELTLDEAGSYRVLVCVGGYVQSEESFDVQ
jgi:hypothetical protein